VVDLGGNLNAAKVSVTVRSGIEDTVPPTVAIRVPSDAAAYTVGDVVVADYACEDNVAVASCEGPVASGMPIDTAVPGGFTFEVTATDTSGNRASGAVSYRVVAVGLEISELWYPGTGEAKAGRTSPLSWQALAGGWPVTDPDHFIGVFLTCSDRTHVPQAAVGQSGLQYREDGWWQFNWKTPSDARGSCAVSVEFADGSVRTIAVLFRR